MADLTVVQEELLRQIEQDALLNIDDPFDELENALGMLRLGRLSGGSPILFAAGSLLRKTRRFLESS